MAATARTVGSPGSPLDYYKSHPKGKPLASAQKQTVLNVYYKLRQKHPKKLIEDVVNETAELTGVSANSVFRMKKEFQTSGGKLVTRGQKRPKGVGKHTRLMKYNEFTLSSIRQKIRGCSLEGKTTTAKKICSAINDDPELPNFSERTMQRLIRDLGFSYKKCSGTSKLVERKKKRSVPPGTTSEVDGGLRSSSPSPSNPNQTTQAPQTSQQEEFSIDIPAYFLGTGSILHQQAMCSNGFQAQNAGEWNNPVVSANQSEFMLPSTAFYAPSNMQ